MAIAYGFRYGNPQVFCMVFPKVIPRPFVAKRVALTIRGLPGNHDVGGLFAWHLAIHPGPKAVAGLGRGSGQPSRNKHY